MAGREVGPVAARAASWGPRRRCSTRSGSGSWTYAASFGTDPVISSAVSEWQRTSPLTIPGALFYASLVAAAVFLVAQARTKGRVLLTDWLWLAGWGLIGAWAERGLAWWPFAAAFVVGTVIGRATGSRASRAGAAAEPAQRCRGPGTRPARRRRAPVVAAAGPADRPRGAAELRAVRPRPGAARRWQARRPDLHAADLGVVVRMVEPAGARVPRLPLRAVSGAECSRPTGRSRAVMRRRSRSSNGRGRGSSSPTLTVPSALRSSAPAGRSSPTMTAAPCSSHHGTRLDRDRPR